MKQHLFPFRRPAVLGTLFLVVAEVLASLVRVQFLPGVPYLREPALWIGCAVLKGLLLGPILGNLTASVWRFWRFKQWDEACYLCLRGGFILTATQSAFGLLAFLTRSSQPFLAWSAASWWTFGLWLTLNVALLWSLLLLVAGFLLPADSRKTIQISESLRL